jgi:4-hydroxy-3-methylbut-2-en-1-yl diphosphate synthase IspG/GcpE
MRKSREIKLGNIKIGGGNPPVLQTMVTTPLDKFEKILFI